MWSVLTPPRTVLVTRALAIEFAEMESPPHDRPLSERRLMVYRRALANGGFRPVSWATCWCDETGQTYRVNGKHTSTMLSGLDEIPEFYAVIESYTAESLEDVAKLYGTFDSRSQVRTASDINRTFAASVPELATIQPRTINVIVSGISYHRWQDQYGSVPTAERAELLLDHVDFALWVHGLIGNSHTKDARSLARVPVVGAMLSTWSKSRKDSTAFWESVRDETGESPSLPDRKLAKWLSTVNVNNGVGAAAANSRKSQPREFYVKCIHAWNAWRKDQSSDLKYYAQAKVPVAI
jgi:hypothetical protein